MLAYGFDRAEPEFARERNLLRDDRERRAELIVRRCGNSARRSPGAGAGDRRVGPRSGARTSPARSSKPA